MVRIFGYADIASAGARRGARLAGRATVLAAAGLFLMPAAPAGATWPSPEVPTSPAATVERVEVRVPVPVDDRRVEAIQMVAAAILGAGAASVLRPRRRTVEAGEGPDTLIDITETVQRGN